MAAQVVANKIQLPGLDRSVSATIRKEVAKQLKTLGTEIGAERETRSAEQRETAYKLALEKNALDRMAAAPEYLRGESQDVVQGRAEDARLAALSEQMTAPVQEQRNLFAEEAPGAVTRTFTRAPDKAKLGQLIDTALQRDVSANDRALLEQISDNLNAYASDPAATEDAVDYIYKKILTPGGGAVSFTKKEAFDSAKDIKDRLQLIEQAKLSETEQQTQLARRRLTEEERQALVGTSLGPRAQTGVVEEGLGKTIADYAQKAKIGTPIREATDEVRRAVQGELSFTDRRGEPTAQKATTFGSWRDFQDYLSSDGLQMLRAANQDVANGAYPNVHRASNFVQNMLARADSIRAKASDVAKQRQAVVSDAQTARQLLQSSVAELEKSLKLQTPDPQLIKGIRTAKEKLAAARALRDQLNKQLQDNVDALKGKIEAYEEGFKLAGVR
jgi:hypothetical protein